MRRRRERILFVSLLLAVLSGMDARAGSVFTSQVGFAPADSKAAVLAMPTGADVQQAFRVLDAATSAVVYTS